MAAKKGLYANIHAKRKRIAAGSGEKMRKPGSKGAPTAANLEGQLRPPRKNDITSVHRLCDACYLVMERGLGIGDYS
jgi:hypothetical protein